jgi:hypothetical protein
MAQARIALIPSARYIDCQNDGETDVSLNVDSPKTRLQYEIDHCDEGQRPAEHGDAVQLACSQIELELGRLMYFIGDVGAEKSRQVVAALTSIARASQRIREESPI